MTVARPIREKRMKKWMIASAAAAGVGALTAIGFLVAMGVDYRMQEATGAEPGYTSDGIVGGFQVGLWLLAIGIVALVVCGVVAAARRRGGSGPTSPSER
ncbi:hypothetical protein [Curtobacterium sp. UCD-KPL2560]|uniref:hypothetical protein n=1 Tax=Curtobacterium sp. UCD-KPL2560 TaxID=1885315 RepID=UPI00114CD6B0|nr:hypothetical protein [Curtobacterium sp. UCD-KPL2560]